MNTLKPTPAVGWMPFPGHRNMAEIAAEERGEVLSGYRYPEPRNTNLTKPAPMTQFGRSM